MEGLQVVDGVLKTDISQKKFQRRALHLCDEFCTGNTVDHFRKFSFPHKKELVPLLEIFVANLPVLCSEEVAKSFAAECK